MTTEGRPAPVAEGEPREKRAAARKSAPRAIVLPPTLSVKRLSELTGISAINAIKQLMRNGIMASMNQVIDFEMATLVTSAFEVRVRPERDGAGGAGRADDATEDVDTSKLETRSPVVAILGHVDHGKTTLLDTIRNTRVASREVGGITQHIGAYQVKYKDRDITFLDTPGHEAFTAIRARGARATDIAVLVVAADDGIMPQTIEALDHARAAGVTLAVAINKVDRPEADVERVKRQLGEHSLVLEEWGGDVIAIPVSATQGDGVEDLLDSLQLLAEVADLKADPTASATGVVIEAKLDKARGPLATVLVQNGTLRVGDHVRAAASWGRVKAMINDTGKRITEAGPSVPVEMMGFGILPDAGDLFTVVPNEKAAKDAVEDGARILEVGRGAVHTLTLEEVSKGAGGEAKELKLIIKADVQGSVEAVVSALERLNGSSARVRILHAGSGAVTESDVLLASASEAIIIGFGSNAQPGVERLAEREGVEIRHYEIIYRLTEDIQSALEGVLEATFHEVVQGRAEVRVVFSIGRRSKIAGCRVVDGRITRGSMVRVIRNGETKNEGTIASIRHFKEEVNEMAAGFECGIGLSGFTDFEEGDVLETYRRERGRA